MNDDARLQATQTVWIAIAFIFTVLMVTSNLWGNGLREGHIFLGVVLAVAGMGATSFIWDGAKSGLKQSLASDQDKAKRQVLDDVLRDLSDEDLMRLKQRLTDGTIDDDLLYEQMTLSDDGELIPMDRKS